MSLRHHHLLPVLSTGLIAACATGQYGPPSVMPGQPADVVLAQLGEPNDRHALPDGASRLEFARGPMGRHTYMVDVDVQGRVIAWRQVLTADTVVNRVRAGMRESEVRRELGRPGRWMVAGVSGRRFAMWRFEGQRCEVLGAEFEGDTLVSAGVTMDPGCR